MNATEITNSVAISQAWLSYTHRVKRFWSEQTPATPPTSNSVILVEMLADRPPYLLGNMFLAKFLQLQTGGRLVGMVRGLDKKIAPLAAAFGFSNLEVRDLSRLRSESVAELNRFQSNVGMAGDLTDYVLSLKTGGIPIGDLIYDHHLRFNDLPTLKGVEPAALARTLMEAAGSVAHSRALLDRYPVSAVVTGHRVYNDFGIPVRMAVDRGIPVYSRKPAARHFTVRRYATIEDTRHHEYRMSVEELERFSPETLDRIAATGKEWMDTRFAGQVDRADQQGLFDGFDVAMPRAGRRDLLEPLGLDPSRYTICALSHAFSDEAHAGSWSIYTDYYEWLEKTLEIAGRMPDVNWVIKSHPHNSHYGLEPVEEKLVAAAGLPNVGLYPEECNLASLLDVADAIVTVRGSPALEFAVYGKPVVTAGDAWFSGWGFAHEPHDAESYERVLQDLPGLPLPTAKQRRMACMFSGMRYIYSLVEGSFLPPSTPAFWLPLDWEAFLREAEALLDTVDLSEDLVYRNFATQVENGYPHLLRYDSLLA